MRYVKMILHDHTRSSASLEILSLLGDDEFLLKKPDIRCVKDGALNTEEYSVG